MYRVALVVLGALLPFIIYAWVDGVYFVTSGSVPPGLYASARPADFQSLNHGDYVVFRYVEPSWAQGRYVYRDGQFFTKRIGAVPGDTIYRIGSRLVSFSASDGVVRELGEFLVVDSAGRPIPQDLWPHEGVRVPNGFYYMTSTRVRNGYDSRYYRFVPISRLVDKVRPVWVRD